MIAVVNNSNYLVVTLNYTGNFRLNTQTLGGKGLEAMIIINNCYF